MSNKTYLTVLLCVLSFALPSFGTIAIDQVSFHDSYYITSGGPEGEGGTADAGGMIMVFVRNTGATTETFVNKNITINGTAVGSIAGFKWCRPWPVSVAPGQVTTIAIKGNSSPIAEGQSVTINVTSDQSSSASNTGTLATPLLRVGNVVPSQDFTSLYIYVRNTNTSSSYTISSVYVDTDVTSQCTFVGGTTVAAKGVNIIKVTYPNDSYIWNLRPLAIRLVLSDGSKVGAFIRVTEPIFAQGTWAGVDLVQTHAKAQEARNSFMHDFIGPGYSNWDYGYMHARYNIKGMDMPGNSAPYDVAKVQEYENKPNMYGWFVDDEPELGNRLSPQLFGASMNCWDNDQVHPTMINNAKNKVFQEYGMANDHPCYDHYCQFAPLCYSASQYSIKNSFWYTDSLKRNCEPLRIWVYGQGVASTWGTQAYDWGIKVQFWNQLLAGTKGVKWFFAKDESGYAAQYTAIKNVLKELAQVKNIALYSDVSNNCTTSNTNVLASMLVGEDAVVAIATNSSGVYNYSIFSKSASMTNLTGINLTFTVPSHITIQQVKQVTPTGLVTQAYTQNGQVITISNLTLDTTNPHKVFLIGKNDTTAPVAPKNLNVATWESATAVLSWQEGYDNYGVQGYKVYRNSAEIADVKVPLYKDTAGSATATYTIKSYDAAGNLSAASQALCLAQPKWYFDNNGDFGAWTEIYGAMLPTETWSGSWNYGVRTGGQPSIFGPELRIDASTYKKMRIRFFNGTSAYAGCLYFNTDGQTKNFPYGQWFDFPSSTGQWVTVDCDLTANANWTGTIKCLRLDLPGYNQFDGEYINVDYIEFITASGMSAPTVTNASGVSNLTKTTARLNGQITATGGENPTAIIYWGPTDGGTTSGNWANSVNVGTQSGAFYTDISGLTPGTTYYYRCYASNTGGNDWADSTASFTIGTFYLTINGQNVENFNCAIGQTYTIGINSTDLLVVPEPTSGTAGGMYGQMTIVSTDYWVSSDDWGNVSNPVINANMGSGGLVWASADPYSNIGHTGWNYANPVPAAPGLWAEWTYNPLVAGNGVIYLLTWNADYSQTTTWDAITITNTAGDTTPPTPNPATFATAPYATGSTAIAMVATTGSDASGPVQYLFTETSGNPGATSSGWQTSTSYTDSGLNPGTQYTYTVTMRDALANTGTASSPASATTQAASAPTFVAAGAISSGTATITPALPSGIASGDILLLFVETANQAVSVSNQNGGTWAEVTNSPQGTGTAAGTAATRLAVFWSRYNGTQGAPTVSDSGNHQMARIVAIRGAVASGNPWDVTAGGVETTSDTSGSIPGATTTVANTLVVVAVGGSLPDATGTAQFSAWTNANLTSLTERTDNSVTAGNGGSLGVATGVKTTAGAYGNTAVTHASSAVKGMMSIAIKN